MNLGQLEHAHKLTIRRANILQAIIRLKDSNVRILVNEPNSYDHHVYWHSDGIDIEGNDKSHLCQAMAVVLQELIVEIDVTLRSWGIDDNEDHQNN